jgi:hypothetical protein
MAFKDFTTDDFLSGKASELKLHHFSQKTICFKDNSTLLIADERLKDRWFCL